MLLPSGTQVMSWIREGFPAVRSSIEDGSAAQAAEDVQSSGLGGGSVGGGSLSPAPASTDTATNYPYVVVYALS